MNSWADESEDHHHGNERPLEQAPSEYTGGGGVRPRLQLKPRSANPGSSDPSSSSSSSGGSKSNPFGAAKPREEVLASKGIDASLVDMRVERKASVARLTAEQDRRVEALRKELTDVEERLREANEMELPEEDLRVESESKRDELNALIASFHEVNFAERNGGGGGGGSGSGGGGRKEQGQWKSVIRDDRSGLQRAPAEYTTGGASSASSVLSSTTAKKFERPSERRRRLEQQKQREGVGVGGKHGRGGRGGRGQGGGERTQQEGGGGGHYDGRGSRGGGYNDEGYSGSGRGSNNSGYNEKYASDRYNY
ncbi:hypothetical protein ACHAXA_009711 [Cyclostephanos tholiformis]|uniref:Uncharacterized protein n=1 Tax=Cyclostephanos tholiformis TaxID=382380 RepID=A0ABD3RV33_9STRA